MRKLRQISIALVLALMLCVTMLGTGAFAQSITQTAATSPQHTAQEGCQGYWHPGYWHEGWWQPGWWQNGYWENGYWHPGYWHEGYWHPGYWHEGWCEWQGYSHGRHGGY